MTDAHVAGTIAALELLPSCAPQTNNSLRHGHARHGSESPTWVSWQAMLARCRYLKRDVENKHVGRGITFDPAWLSFEKFLSDMGPRPSGMTLDRIDNDKCYSAANCRWATPRQQARNRRNAIMNFEKAKAACLLMLSGKTAREVAAEFGCSESLPREIIKGRTWPDASAEAHSQWESNNG